jgi:hypothetical protein
MRSPDFTCDALTGEVGEGDFTECEAEALAYLACVEDNGGGEGGQGGV